MQMAMPCHFESQGQSRGADLGKMKPDWNSQSPSEVGPHWENREKFYQDQKTLSAIRRIESLDFARGLAIALMILSHTVKGLLSYEQIPDWGLVPVHLLTKFSSSLFFLAFGISLALFFIPSTETSGWSRKRNRLVFRGFLILLWYKILTVAQMFETYPREAIIDTLLFKNFPDFVEVLGFYGFFLLWIPWVLPLWRKSPFLLKLAAVVALASLGEYLTNNFAFWDLPALKAILVEDDGYYTFGQFQRGALVLFGCLIGEFYLAMRFDREVRFGLLLIGLASLCSFAFRALTKGDFSPALQAIAKNVGKHPPEEIFMIFSVGGAFLILGLAFLFSKWLPKILAPLTWLGQAPLTAFVLHILVIFIGFRYYFNLRDWPYEHVLGLAFCLILGISLVAWIFKQTKRRSH